MTDNKLFTPAEFRNRLKEVETSKSPAITPVAGLVRESELGDAYIQLSMTVDTWVDLPYSMIDHIEHIRDARGKNESHPIVMLHFKAFDNPEIQAIIALMEHKADLSSRKQQTLGSGTTSQCSCSGAQARSTPTVMPGGDILDSHIFCTLGLGSLAWCIECLNECSANGSSVSACRCC